MKAKLTLLATVIINTVNFSQVKDSTSTKTMAYIAEKFPITRVLNVEYNRLSPYAFSSKLRDQELPQAKVKDFYRAKMSANLNLIKKQKWVLSTNLNYRYISAGTEMNGSIAPLNFMSNEDYHYHSESLSLTYFSKLFGRMMIYSASALLDGSEQHFERLRGIATATMILKVNAKTKMTVGLLVAIDPTVQTPVIPTFTYEHRFSKGLVADIILPKSVYLRKKITENSRLSIGSELDMTSLYLYNIDDKEKKYEFRQIEINSGLMYEHYLGNSFVATLKGGAKSMMRSRIFEKSASYGSYIFQAKPQTAFYVNLGLSFDPFIKKTAGQ
ncbi:DUF6268 family outer membrane beta-barrel protein [Chryseobacterium echinoideorum]|uniref:DUF6268 family outer membrane beta-barrel protein n=1 Tax=Chryseobacterium echinoideorum TaxID=1549648 RepID=UPI0011869555|nr:DUF6268 family outer membrane beta-barrel protein [Chryseobacterium echinoideorum]